MSIIGSNILAGASGQAAGGGYAISRSLRFNSADSSFLSRTPASAGNRKTWTLSFWFKLGRTIGYQYFISANNPSGGGGSFDILQMDNAASTIVFWGYNGSSDDWLLSSTAVFRDPSAWQHFVIAFDTTQATASNRVKWWHNGNLLTLNRSGYTTYPSLNADSRINNTVSQRLSDQTYGLDSYLADIHFIDGQALDPTSFGEFDDNGIWQPKAFAGSYGTNGFRLDFSNNASTTTLGEDAAGSNDWTLNNFSVAAGAGNDSLVDVPTNGAQTDTGAGGEVRGNYATLNPLTTAAGNTLSEGNLFCNFPGTASGTANAGPSVASIAVSSGKWYWEFQNTVQNWYNIGIVPISTVANYNFATASANLVEQTGSLSYYIRSPGYFYTGASFVQYGSAHAVNDITGVALDLDAGTLTYYKNGVSEGVAATGISGTYLPFFENPTIQSSGGGDINFGQRPFAYTAPSGFKALSTANLPAPVVTKPSDVMDVALYTGNNTARSITGLAFNPDLVWIKGRSGATDHALYDAVRGVQKDLVSNSTAAETTQTTGLTAFNSDGFSIGTLAKLNTNAATYAAWAWDAGSSTVTNTSGSISSQVRANASAGFSIVSWDSNNSNATVGHGLNVEPYFIILRRRNTTENWIVYHKNMGGNNGYLLLNSTAAFATNVSPWNSTTPTSSVFSYNNTAVGGGNGNPMIAYCFAPVAGYSSFGSYTGNGSADGPFVYTGFRPRWVMIKNASDTRSWLLYDTARDTYNVSSTLLLPDSSGAELANVQFIDITSNGFKIRGSTPAINGNTNSLIYAAFAEHPFQYARAR